MLFPWYVKRNLVYCGRQKHAGHSPVMSLLNQLHTLKVLGHPSAGKQRSLVLTTKKMLFINTDGGKGCTFSTDCRFPRLAETCDRPGSWPMQDSLVMNTDLWVELPDASEDCFGSLLFFDMC